MKRKKPKNFQKSYGVPATQINDRKRYQETEEDKKLRRHCQGTSECY